ncbi:MAG: Phosphotransferase enzyme family protein [Firmicutes bacterium ADurb.Bin248]|nr:MAG: Phosphotransferase enzyme family protein [Firmicutes bacterium ADurb.Bin248]HPK14513.1 aminoglycoside phosphotransferase family protein [Clostridia bacterium]
MNLQLIGEGKTTKVYRDGNRALKLYVGASPEEAYREAEKQAFAFEAGLPVPKVYGVEKLDCGTALVMEYIDGKELAWPRMDRAERKAVFEKLVGLQLRVHGVDAKGLPPLSERLARRIKHAPYLDETAKERLAGRLRDLDKGGTCLCHGDFHTSNVLDDGGKQWIIDWVDAVCGDPLADACRSYLIFRQYISRMSGVYLKLYCKRKAVEPEAVLAWLPVVAAARLSENMNERETAFLLDMIRPDQLSCF